MRTRKKGADAATSTPTMEQSMTIHTHLNTTSNVCLMLFVVFLILIYTGTYTGNVLLTILGLGVGGSAGLILARINTEEE